MIKQSLNLWYIFPSQFIHGRDAGIVHKGIDGHACSLQAQRSRPRNSAKLSSLHAVSSWASAALDSVIKPPQTKHLLIKRGLIKSSIYLSVDLDK